MASLESGYNVLSEVIDEAKNRSAGENGIDPDAQFESRKIINLGNLGGNDGAAEPAIDGHIEDIQFNELLDKMKAIRTAKRADYNAGKMNNFELSDKLFGVNSYVGILIRMSDKLSRLGSFVQKGFHAVKDESIEDTLLDLANYSLICIIEYRKSKHE